jgi:hypothetical protein
MDRCRNPDYAIGSCRSAGLPGISQAFCHVPGAGRCPDLFLTLISILSSSNIKELQERMEREASLTAMLREAELNKLRAQIKPHFPV